MKYFINHTMFLSGWRLVTMTTIPTTSRCLQTQSVLRNQSDQCGCGQLRTHCLTSISFFPPKSMRLPPDSINVFFPFLPFSPPIITLHVTPCTCLRYHGDHKADILFFQRVHKVSMVSERGSLVQHHHLLHTDHHLLYLYSN